MPGSGFNSQNMKLAREMLEACRFSYKAYAQSCTYPLDPFFESHGDSDSARTRLMATIHGEYRTSADAAKFDPVDYDLKKAPNPGESIVYRGGVKTEPYILLQPRDFDRKIAFHSGFDLEGQPVPYGGGDVRGATGRRRCAYFQGKTGMTLTWKTSGWPTWLGAVIYDPESGVAIIAFRGSRSGNGARALMGAKFKSLGSPDWVTDMNYLKAETVTKFGGAQMSCGFYHAYESCKKSLKAAYMNALGGATPRAVYITGHSLGGALAQVAYLDFTSGDLYREIPPTMGAGMVPVKCFGMSAPPIILGRDSHRRIAMDCDATQILHYFCPGDAVHSSPILDGSLIPTAMRVGNWALENFTHPLTSPIHLGCEIQLSSQSHFPESHEPRDVYRGLNAGMIDGNFWPTFTFSHTALSGPYVSDESPNGPTEEIRAALERSVTPDMALARAMQWRSVIKDSSNSEQLTKNIGLWQKAVDLTEKLQGSTSSGVSTTVKQTIRDTRKVLVTGALAKSNMATSSAYWTLLQGLSVRESYIR